MENPKKKVNVYVDGFNFYYALRNKIKDPSSERKREYQRCDLRTLFSHFLKADEELHQVYFFTAYRLKDIQSVARHKVYVEALTKYGVKVVLGKYLQKTSSYKIGKHIIKQIIYDGTVDEQEKCKRLLQLLEYFTFEEKETDVKIAIQIVADAFNGDFDHAYIVSGDSDITPAIQTIRRQTKDNALSPKIFSSILIPGTKGQKIRELCDICQIITAKDMENSILPHQIQIDQNKVLQIPQSWLK